MLERFWVDVVVENPLNAEITLSEFTVAVEDDTGSSTDIDVEVVESFRLLPKENLKVRQHIQLSSTRS